MVCELRDIARGYIRLFIVVGADAPNRTILVLHRHCEKTETFVLHYQLSESISFAFRVFSEQGLEDHAIEEETVTMTTGLQYRLFYRNFVTVLKKQILSVLMKDLMTVEKKSRYFSSLMYANVGNVLFKAVKGLIKIHIGGEVTWTSQ